MLKLLILIFFVVSQLVPAGTLLANPKNEAVPIFNYASIHQPVIGKKGMVVTQNHYATRVGAGILDKGGNAVDAAVAVGLALAVTLPRAGNLGGGGFMVIHLAGEKRNIVIDYRETAPARSHQNMFKNKSGGVNNDLAWYSHLSSGVPGTVAGMAHALEKYGTMPWAEVIEPAIGLAEQGFPVTYNMADALKNNRQRLIKHPATREAFFKPGAKHYLAGETLRQPDLAWSLRSLRNGGPDAFYKGEIANKIVSEMERGGGIISRQDLANYRIKEREPVKGTYRGYEIVSVSPPSSGGTHLVQMLNILEHFPLGNMGRASADTIHVMVEAMKFAYRDRSQHMGDSDFSVVPYAALTSKSYAAELVKGISQRRTRPSNEIRPGQLPGYESPDTTHFSVMDAEGNAVSNTYTLNFSFGSGITVTGAGFLLNNEMDDFAKKPGTPDAYGLVTGEANSIVPGKRPLSSMSPTIILHEGKPFLVVGTPGGSHMINDVLQTIINVIDHDLNIAEAVHQPRFHHQWLPDRLDMEPGFSPDTLRLLEDRGHNIRQMNWASGSVQAIVFKDGLYFGGADPRRADALAIGIH